MLPNVKNGDRLALYKLGTPEKGEFGVFTHPSNTDKESGESQFLKRLVAGPGDTIRIINQLVSVNGAEEIEFDKLFDYSIETNALGLSAAQKEAHHLEQGGMVRVNELYKYSLTKAQAKAVEDEPNVEFVEAQRYPKGITGRMVAQFAQDPKALAWNLDNFGPLICPEKEMRIILNDENLNIYTSLLERFENKRLKKVDELFYVNEVQADSVSFSKNYFFFLGDNRHQSIDSRSYGLIPEEKLRGTAFRFP